MEESVPSFSAEDLYKSFIKNEDTTSCLQNFVNCVENKTSEYDMVKEYLHVSGNCKEILQLVKDIPNLDFPKARLLLKTLCYILIRVGSDLHMFSTIGTSVVNEILSHAMKTIFVFLQAKQKPTKTKLSLHLLSSMVAIGGETAHHVVSKLDFSNTTFTNLLTRRKFSEEEDVRATFIKLIIIIMTTCDFRVIRKLVEIKGFLNDILRGLASDRAQDILVVLSTFRKLIVESILIPKGTKLRLFNENSLLSVIRLYCWKGPVMLKKFNKRKLGEEEQPVAYEVSEAEYVSVQNCAHQFMLSLCSFKTGIIFRDSSCGTSGKNLNQVLTNILKHMPKPHTNKLASEFVIFVLKTCPDQLNFYLCDLKESFMPRLSPQWINVVDVIKKIIMAQDPVSCLFNNVEKKTVPSLINIAISVCFPNLIELTSISDIFQSGNPFICYHFCDFLICVLTQIKKVLEHSVTADFSKSQYSATDISAFRQSFSSTIIQTFAFIKDVEMFWGKLISSKKNEEPVVKDDTPVDKDKESPKETHKELSHPPLSSQLLKVLEVIQLSLDIYSDGYHEFDLNLPKLFQSFKECHSLLSQEEIYNVNIKIVDMISTQGEEAISLWNKKLIDSPLRVILDVYLTSPSADMIEDVSKILKKVLMHTKVFEFCPWEVTVWLESMKSSKTKHIPFVIEFINETMYTLLQNPNKFADDIIENTLEKHNVHSSLDVTAMLNDIFSTKRDIVLIEDFEESQNALTAEKHHFSCLIPAALFTLITIDDHKRKGCQIFIEKVLYHVMHHQQTPEVLFSVAQKYKSSISSNLNDYFALLCPEKQMEMEGDVPLECKSDLSDHLKMKFLTMRTEQNSSKGCHCNIKCDASQFDNSCKEKLIWQLLSYVDWETTFIMEEKIKQSSVLNYLNVLESILNSFDITISSSSDEVMEISGTISTPDENIKLQIVEEILSKPVILKMFLWTEKVPKSKKPLIKSFINYITKLVLTLASELVPKEKYHKILTCYKDKIVKFNSFLFQSSNLQKNTLIYENSDICHLIGSFTPLFSSNDIANMLESLLNLDIKCEDPDLYFSTLQLVFKMYVELKDSVLIYPRAINSLLERYTNMTKKQKKNLRTYIMYMFEKHPIFASAVTADSCYSLLKQTSSKNFYILGSLIDSSDQMRQTVQLAIIGSLEDLKGCPDFIFLVSKCVLNSTLIETDDVNFQETVSSYFWEAVIDYILCDITSQEMLLDNCGAGKALQVLFSRKILSVKKLSKFFKNYDDTLNGSVPSGSKMLTLLQLMEIMKIHLLESNKSAISILKTVFHWLVSVVPSLQNTAEFEYTHLLQFALNLLQGTSEIDLKDIVNPDIFFPKILKVALKYAEIGKDLIDVLVALCQKSKNSNVPAKQIFNLVTGHSNFFKIMLSDVKEEERLKECLIDFLIILVSADNSVCKDNHIGLFLSSYSGTLKSVDRKLLYLIKLYSESNVDMAKFSPFLWSKSAVGHYSVMNNGTMNLWKKPKLQDVLSTFLPDKIEVTAEKYPLTLKLDPTILDSCEELENCTQVEKIYDLRFFLPLFANLLSPGSFVHCCSFIDSKVVILMFTSLSSFDTRTRALGYYCLSQLYGHLEGAKYCDKQIWLCLLDSVRNSITSENPRIPSIVSLFLARATHIFTKPNHPLYSILYKFIMVKPNLDIDHVPEFYKLFNSIELEHTVHRLWLLRLLADGFHSSLDFHICEKRYIFRVLLTHYWSSISLPQEKIEILSTISAAVKIDTPAFLLCQNGLLVWLHSAIEELNTSDVTILKSLCILVKDLWFTTKKFCLKSEVHNSKNEEKEGKNKRILRDSFPHEFQLVLLSFFRKLSNLDISSMKTYLSTLHDVMSFLKTSEWNIFSVFDRSLEHIAEMLKCWQQVEDKVQIINDSKPIKNILDNTYDFKESCTLFSKIILIWSPIWSECTEEDNYNKQVLLVLRAVQKILQFNTSSPYYTSDLPYWLYMCLKEDKRHELVKSILSPVGEPCLKLILNVFEQSLSFQSQFSSTKATVPLCAESKVNVVNYWEKILSHFKKICRSSNLTPELNLYHQITVIL